MNKYQEDKEMFGENNEGKYVLANIIWWIVAIGIVSITIFSFINK